MRCVSLAPLVGRNCPGCSPPVRAFLGGPVSPPEFLELVFELLGQIFDVVRWPVLNVHAKVQTHS
ncbi:hypothetical protein C7964_101403 [Loktanella sp. PT4BL]|nr:hypothetical protein C7964_101403 [Loktanella sp. PT4BL]